MPTGEDVTVEKVSEVRPGVQQWFAHAHVGAVCREDDSPHEHFPRSVPRISGGICPGDLGELHLREAIQEKGGVTREVEPAVIVLVECARKGWASNASGAGKCRHGEHRVKV